MRALPLALAGLCACHPRSASVPPVAADPASAEALLATVRALTAPEMEGRPSGGPGYARAVRLAVERFRALGLEPGLPPATGPVPPGLEDLAREGWLQPFPIEHADIAACDLALVLPDGTEEPLALGEDHACRGFTGSGDVTAEVVFVGYGQARPDLGLDDWAGVDVAGKVVLAFKQAPPWNPAPGAWGDAWMPRPKAAVAASRGAAALLVVPRSADSQPAIGSVMDGPGAAVPLPQIQISLPVAERILAAAGTTPAALEARIGESKAPASLATGARVHVRTVSAWRPEVPTVNVVARLPGAALADETVVVSAHLDHVGCQGAVCWPGANDNASGSAAVLAIAGALAGEPVARSLTFVLYAAEEHGLDGSKAFAADPPVPVDRIVAQVNLDCIGIGDALQVGGGTSAPVLWDLARAIDATSTRRMVEDTWWGGGADAQALFDRGVPTLYFATRNAYAHLHRPSDTVDTLDPSLFADTVSVAVATVRTLAGDRYRGEPRPPQPPPESR